MPRPAAAKDRPKDPMSERTCCLPCLHGVHAACRHHPEGPRFSAAGSEKGKPCECESSGHSLGAGFCAATVHGDWSSHRCGLPAKATMTVGPGDGWSFVANGSEAVEVEVCGRHRSGIERRRANDERYRAESAAREARYDRERGNERAAEDWCARLAEVGVRATPVRDSTRILVSTGPEELYGKIREAVVELDAAGIPHPFHPHDDEERTDEVRDDGRDE